MFRWLICASAAIAISLLTVSGTASAKAPSSHTVCAKGCQFSSIQAAINASAPGDTVSVAHGTYVENIIIDRPLTLSGDNASNTTIEPAVSNPNCGGSGGGSLCPGGSNIILVQADNVTIQNLTLNGDNPALNGVNVGGANVDARNGIITNHLAGTYNNLTVQNVTVENVYLRGIYASSGGTFTFSNDTVSNVQGDPQSSVAMFNFGGSGIFSGNTVSNASDAISSNWSTGTRYLNNTITKSGSGVHTDNNGGSGGSADLIQGNVVNDCTPGGYGTWVFVPYVAPTVTGNSVHNCSVGLAIFGGTGTTSPTVFSGNTVNGDGSASSDGALVTTDQLGYDCGPVFASFTGNMVKNTGTGFALIQGPAFSPDTCSGTPGIVATINGNNIFSNGTGLSNASNTSVNATNDWWGCSSGPNSPGCDTIVNSGTSSTMSSPFLTRPA